MMNRREIIHHSQNLTTRNYIILVTKVSRCLTGMDRETANINLHRKNQQLSVQQRCAFFSVVQVHKSLLYMRPGYHFDRFNPTKEYRVTRRRDKLEVNYMLSISRCSFFYRGCKMYNLLPPEFAKIEKMSHFKKVAKEWIFKNIPLLPP